MKKRILIVLGMFMTLWALTACGHKSSSTPVETPPPPAAPTSGSVKLSATGAGSIGGLDLMINLPAGVTVTTADQTTGEVAAGVVSASGVAAGANTLADAKFIPETATTPAQLHIVMVNPSGFGEGEVITIKFNIAQDATFPTDKSAFSATVNSAVAADNNSTALTGVTIAATTVAADK